MEFENNQRIKNKISLVCSLILTSFFCYLILQILRYFLHTKTFDSKPNNIHVIICKKKETRTLIYLTSFAETVLSTYLLKTCKKVFK